MHIHTPALALHTVPSLGTMLEQESPACFIQTPGAADAVEGEHERVEEHGVKHPKPLRPADVDNGVGWWKLYWWGFLAPCEMA